MASAHPLIIGHRGASGYRPEHTLASYDLAIRLGADVIEPDLVSTRDGVLVARHENELSATTDVADHPEFAARRTTKTVDGRVLSGWFTEDFTVAELKRLHVRDRIPGLRPGSAVHDGRYRIPTFQEVIHLARRWSRRLGRRVAVYPETKHPTHYDSIGLAVEAPLVAELQRHGWVHRTSPVLIQSFEVAILQRLSRITDVRLVQLVDATGQPYDLRVAGDPRGFIDLISPAGLRGVARYAHGVAPHKSLLIPNGPDGRLLAPTSLVSDAHAAGLVVHPWTFRNENSFLPADFRAEGDPAGHGDAVAEYLAFLATGVDGVFSDFPDVAVRARQRHLGGARRAS